MKVKVVIIAMLLCVAVLGCGKSESSTGSVADAIGQRDASSIFTEAEKNALSYNLRSIIINDYNGQELISTTEIYGNLNDDTYEVLYVNEDGDEKVIKTQCSQESTSTTRYYLTEYGWVQATGEDTWRQTFMNLFNIVTPSELTLVDESEYEFSNSDNDCYLLEQVTKSEDDTQIYYVGLYINKEYMVPELISLQTYTKADGYDVDSEGNMYTNVLTESTAYVLGYFKEGDANADVVLEATAIPTDNIISEEEYNAMYWKEVENGETNN